MNALILAGGKSTRMGTDKSLLVYHDKPQREFLFELLQKFCDRVYTSCRIDQDIEEKWNPLPDQYEISGPMNGILTAFHHTPDTAWLIVAVDMPYVNADSVQFLINNRDSSKVATCFFNKERQHPEPLFTLWESSAYPLLADFTRKGKVSPKEFLTTHGVHVIHPPDERILLNVNTPEDFASRKPLT